MAKLSAHPVGWVHSSPLATCHDPLISLSSHCIRQAFGPTVQLVADALQSRGPTTTLSQLVVHLQRTCPPPPQRLGLPKQLPTDKESIRASLLVLIQHSIVSTRLDGTHVRYCYHPPQARNLMRYAKYMEFLKKTAGETVAQVLQVLLVHGRLRTVDWISRLRGPDDRTAHADAIFLLVQQGFVEPVPLLKKKDDGGDDDDDEYEFEPKKPPVNKRIRRHSNDDPTRLALFAKYDKDILQEDAVWRVNFQQFHDYFQAYHLGKLVAERYGSSVQSIGSMVTAALKYRAQQRVLATRQGSFNDASALGVFQPDDIASYLPNPVLQILERKAGGLLTNLQEAWEELATVAHKPSVVLDVGGEGTSYEIDVASLVDYMQERIVHQIVQDRFGDVAARIVTILSRHGWLESETLAEHAMVPAKDVREILHQLYRSRYIEMLQLSTSSKQQHNPATAVFLWGVQKSRLRRKVTENIAQALWNIRLRRQHQMEVGKNRVERAQQAAVAGENDNETDRLNYRKFCLGVERLDSAALQLDETLLAMNDHSRESRN